MSLHLAAKEWGCSPARTCSEWRCQRLQQAGNKGMGLHSSEGMLCWRSQYNIVPGTLAAEHSQLQILDLADQELDGGLCLGLELCLLVLWQLLQHLVQPGLHRKQATSAAAARCTDAFQNETQAEGAVAELHNITTVRFETWLTLM